jgi:hypothetical protein
VATIIGGYRIGCQNFLFGTFFASAGRNLSPGLSEFLTVRIVDSPLFRYLAEMLVFELKFSERQAGLRLAPCEFTAKDCLNERIPLRLFSPKPRHLCSVPYLSAIR